MVTWNDEAPAELPPLSMPAKLVGGVRFALFLGLTLAALGLFLLGRALRHWLGRWVTFHFWVARVWSRAGLRLLGLTLRVKGRPIERGALVANHSSWIDILALRAVRLVYFVSKAEVADWAGVGFVVRVTGTVFIERRRAEAKRQERVLRERIAANQVLCIFPEGTSTDGERVLPFKSSLLSAFFPGEDGSGADLHVQPVTIRYRVAPGSGLPRNFYAWWGTMGFEAHIWDVLCRSRGGEVDVIFHEPLSPAEIGDRKALAERAEAAVRLGHRSGAIA